MQALTRMQTSTTDAQGYPPLETCELLSHSCLALLRLTQDVEGFAARAIRSDEYDHAVLQTKVDLLHQRIEAHEALRAQLTGDGYGLESMLDEYQDDAAWSSEMPLRSLVLAGLTRQRILQHQRQLALQLDMARRGAA